MPGGVLLAKGWEWDRAIPRADRDQILERIFRLPGWVDNQLGADNLDVKRLEGHNELLRLRWGDHRVVFQILGPTPVIHRGCTESVSRPTKGASRIDIIAIGTSSRADSVGDRPRTSWA